MLKLGERNIPDVRLGEQKIAEIRLGEALIWQSGYERTFANLKRLAQAGIADKVVKIGDEIPSTYVYNGVTYDAPWIVVHIGAEEFEDGHVGQAVTLEWKYASIETLQMDAAHLDPATEQTAVEGLTYIARDGSTYALLDLQPGDTVPYSEHGNIYHDAIRDTTLNTYKYGHNRIRDCAIRQWLNSDAAKGNWYTPPGIGYRNPSALNSYAGFIAGLSSDVLDNAAKIKRTYYCNSVTDGSAIDMLYDKFFIGRGTELYGSVNANEGVVWDWYKKVTDLTAPSNAADVGRVKYRVNASASAQDCWVGSAYHSNSSQGWRRHTSGLLTSTYVSANNRVVPACSVG